MINRNNMYMKSLITKFVLGLTVGTCLIFGLSGCGGNTASFTADATGSPYELLAAVPQTLWEGATGDTLRHIFLQPIPVLNQEEPWFSMIRIIPSKLTGFLQKHRNILIVKVDPDQEKANTVAAYDVYASPQIIATVTAPSEQALTEYLSENRQQLLDLYEITERNRNLAAAKKYKEPSIEKTIYEMFGMKIDIPRGYKLRNRIGNDFIWISNEYPTASQGLFIYSAPYRNREDLEVKGLVARRNEFAAKIPGPSEGSYMITAKEFEPEVRYLRINGRLWSEMRGFWDVENDFMGGPMVSYSTLDANTSNVVTIDCYVYSPKYPKRNLLRGLEHIIYSVEFPEPATGHTQQ